MRDDYQGEGESSKQVEGDIFDPTLEAKHRGGTRQKSSRSDIMKQAMESRGLGKFVRKHEQQRPANDNQLDCTQGGNEDIMIGGLDPEVKSQNENLGPRVEFDQYLPCTPDQSLRVERHGDGIQPTHSATSSSSLSLRYPKREDISGSAAKAHEKNGISEAILKASTRRLRTPRFGGGYTGRCRRFRTTTTSHVLQVRTSASNHLIATIHIINKKVQQGLQRTRPRVRSSSSTQTTSETANIITKDSALPLIGPQKSEPSDLQIAIHPSLQKLQAAQRTDCTVNPRISPITDLQIRSLLSLKQRSTAQFVVDTYVKRPDGQDLLHLFDLSSLNTISPHPELYHLPSAIGAKDQETRIQTNAGHRLPQVWTSNPPLQDLVSQTGQHMHNLTDNADFDLDSDDRVIAPKIGVRKQDMEKMKASGFDNDAAPGFQAMLVISPSHKASDRVIKANTANCASQPLETAFSKIESVRQRRNLGGMIRTEEFQGYVALESINTLCFKVQAGLVQSHVVLSLPQAIKFDCQMHRITNSVYLMVPIGHNKACSLLILSVMRGTGCQAQDLVSLLLKRLDSLFRRRQQNLTPHQYLQWSVPFYNSVPPSKSLLMFIAAAPPGTP